LGSRRQGSIIVTILTKKLQKFSGILTDEFSKMWVASTNRLKDGLKHLRRTLDDLAELLKLWVVS
jgi:hypothetical protein